MCNQESVQCLVLFYKGPVSSDLISLSFTQRSNHGRAQQHAESDSSMERAADFT